MRHIVGRVNHPQTNGKVERFYGTVEQKLPLFDGGLDVLMEWYNEKKPHMSLSHDGRRYDTPQEAFWYKMSPERLLGYSKGWMGGPRLEKDLGFSCTFWLSVCCC